MTIKEKIALSEKDNQLILFKEGIFYKLYNKHAMLFHQNSNAYKITVKFYKNINQNVYSLGFPIKSFKPTNLGPQIELVTTPTQLLITNCNFKHIPNFNTWKLKFKPTAIPHHNKTNNNAYEALKQQILKIPIIDNTPLQVMVILNNIQQELKTKG